MKGILFDDDSQGAEFEVVDIPADLVELATRHREQMIEAVAEFDDEGFVLRGVPHHFVV